MKQEKSKFELLRSKSIIAILDGDKDFGPLIINGVDSGIKISMPYLSGPMLCTISNNWGLPATYDRNGGAKTVGNISMIYWFIVSGTIGNQICLRSCFQSNNLRTS